MEPGTLQKTGGVINLPKFKIKNKFDLKDSLAKVSHMYKMKLMRTPICLCMI